MRSHPKPGRSKMPLVALVLEMLRTTFPDFALEGEPWVRAAEDGAAAAAPGGGSERGHPEPQVRRHERRQTSRKSRPRQARGAPQRALDPVLERCYASLGVSPGARIEVVRSAWRRLVRQYHPDLYAEQPDQQQRNDEKVKELNLAYEELKRRLR
ncbi:MAG: J domain-containing protein [Thermoanaerobaculia bacterium]